MSADELAQAVANLRIAFLSDCCSFAACAIYLYDRCLVASREVDMIRSHRNTVSLATGLYFVLQLSMGVYQCINVMMDFLTGSCESGYITDVVDQCSLILFQVAYGAITALRAYAISNRSAPLVIAVLMFSFVPVGINIYEICAIYTIAVPQPVACIISSYVDADVGRILIVTGQASAIIPDVLLLGAIWHHAYNVKITNISQKDTPYTTVFLRDGTIYFLTLLVVLIINTTLSAADHSTDGSLSPMAYALQAIIISHFFLNLSEANSLSADASGSSPNTTQMSDVRFTRVIGSLAGSLAYGAMDRAPSHEWELDSEIGEVQCIDAEVREMSPQSFGSIHFVQ